MLRSSVIFVCLFASVSAQCVFTSTECTCSQESSGKICLRYSSGVSGSELCESYECNSGYGCYLPETGSGTEMCDLVECAEGTMAYQPTDTTPATAGEIVSCTPTSKTQCITPRVSPTASPSPTPSNRCNLVDAPIINELEPFLVVSRIEIRGMPNTQFDGHVVLIGSSTNGAFNGVVKHSEEVAGTFDSNGLLVATIDTSEATDSIIFGSNILATTVVLSSEFGSSVLLDQNNDGAIDDTAVFGTIYDAIGLPLSSAGTEKMYGANLEGTDFDYVGAVRLVFRDTCNEDLYAVSDTNEILNTVANQVDTSGFDSANPQDDTFGAINPSYS